MPWEYTREVDLFFLEDGESERHPVYSFNMEYLGLVALINTHNMLKGSMMLSRVRAVHEEAVHTHFPSPLLVYMFLWLGTDASIVNLLNTSTV